jgi:hypothetical protein
MQTDDAGVTRRVSLKRVYPDDLDSHFVSNVVVQHQPDHFIISFFEVWPPPILGKTAEERQEALDAIQEVEAKCVARLVVTPTRMRELIDTLSENWDTYQRAVTLSPSAEPEEEL